MCLFCRYNPDEECEKIDTSAEKEKTKPAPKKPAPKKTTVNAQGMQYNIYNMYTVGM